MELYSMSGEIELTKLKFAVMPSKKDPDEIILCIPVKLNNLEFHKSKNADDQLIEDRSRIKLPFTAWLNDEDKRKYSTHSIQQNFSKELREKLKAENEGKEKSHKVYAPYIGNVSPMKSGGMGQSAQPSAAAQTIAQGCEDDLPF